MFGGKAFGEEMVEIVRGYVERVAAPLVKRIETLEAAAASSNVVEAIIDREGALILTFADGRTKNVGPVVGKDVDQRAVEAQVKTLIEAIPYPQDGLGFDDLDVVVGEEGVMLRFVRGETVKEFPLPVVIDRGVFKEGGAYRKGNGVTWGGSFWIAQKDAPQGKPDAPESGWRLAVKRGQNGKDAAK